jgi:hypothetical protein
MGNPNPNTNNARTVDAISVLKLPSFITVAHRNLLHKRQKLCQITVCRNTRAQVFKSQEFTPPQHVIVAKQSQGSDGSGPYMSKNNSLMF